MWPGLWSQFLARGIAPETLRAEWFRQALPAVGIAVDHDRAHQLAQRYEEAFEAGLRAYPDVLPALTLTTLREVRPDLVYGLITNGWGARQRKRAAATGLGASKPEARIFEVALARARALPSEAVMGRDDSRTDIVGAKAVGMHALWVNRRGRAWPGPTG